MIEFDNQVVVERPVDEVFRFVSNFENIPKWNYYVLSVKKTSPGPVAIGTIFHQVRKTDQQDFEIITYRPNRQVSVRTIPPSMPKFEMHFTFEPDGEGTRVTDQWKLDTGRPALLEHLATGRIKSAVLENLEKMKELLETGQVSLQDGRQATL